MKKAFISICLSGILIAAVGCSRSTPEERYLSHWEKITSLISQNKHDPQKVQAELKSYLDAHLSEMKSLIPEFWTGESKKIVENTDFLRRVLDVIDVIKNLEKTDKSLLDDPRISQVIAPLIEIVK